MRPLKQKQNSKMKKLFTLVILAVIVAGQVQAQNKIGYISINEIIAVMPEAKKADTLLNQYRDALISSANDKQAALEADITKFNKDSATYSTAVKEVKRKELQQKYQELSGEEQYTGRTAKEARRVSSTYSKESIRCCTGSCQRKWLHLCIT